MARSKRRSHTLAFKQKVVEDYNQIKSFNKIAKKYDLQRKQIKQWKLQIDDIKKTPNRLIRNRICTNKRAQNPAMEDELYQWFLLQRTRGACIQGYHLQNYANKLMSEEGVEFRASRGWLYRFLERHSLKLRRITTSGRDLPADSRQIALDFMDTCRYTMESLGFHRDWRSCIYNMDETSVYLDAPINYTYETVGTTRVRANTSGHEKSRLSVAFCANASGQKLPLVIVVPRKTPLKYFTTPSNCIIVYKSNGTFDSNVITNTFLKRVMEPHILRENQDEAKLFFDNATCHKTKQVADYAKKIKLHCISIPPRFTNLLQPADIAWMASLKKAYNQKWSNWFIQEEKTFTKAGNMRSPGYENIIRWLSDIWDDFDKDIIISSFDQCGITSNHNLHTTLDCLINENQIINDLVVDRDSVGDENLGFGDLADSSFDGDDDDNNDSEDNDEE